MFAIIWLTTEISIGPGPGQKSTANRSIGDSLSSALTKDADCRTPLICAASGKKQRKEEMQTIRVGGVPEHFNAPWHIAKSRGLFEKAGVDFVWKDFPGGVS